MAFRASTFGIIIKKTRDMKTKKTAQIQIYDSPFNLSETTSKMTLSDVLIRKTTYFLNDFALFMAHYNTIPNTINDKNIDCLKAINWLSENFKTEIKQCYYNKEYSYKNKKIELEHICYLIYDDLIVNFNISFSSVRFLFNKTEISKVDELISKLNKFKKRHKFQPEISLIVENDNGIAIKDLKILKPELSIIDNYNDDFVEIHQTILKRLSRKNDKGIVLLHGKPGTGKTSYIRYLITFLKKQVFFLPSNMIYLMAHPSLMSLFTSYPNSVLVIEDAENIVIDRENNGNSPVSTLLNISDGLLSDCLNIQIICSFNTDISKIDSALMRKGRLIARYEFKELEIDKAQQLSAKLGFHVEIKKPISLTDIYNQNEQSFTQIKRGSSIGFQPV